MYVTRSLSHYKNFPEALYHPPEGPNSGYLVIQDEESETYTCFGLCKNMYLVGLPFPQNKILTTQNSSESHETRLTTRHSIGSRGHLLTAHHLSVSLSGKVQHVNNEVIFIPVLNQPLSSNRYYAIKPRGLQKGEAFTCSKEEDMASCCFWNMVRDVKPRPFNPKDVYQQFEIFPCETACIGNISSFYAKSIAEDGYPPYFLRRNGWEMYTKTPKNYELHEAKGVNYALRSRLPEFNFPSSNIASNSVVVGKWYCPFMFIKEGRSNDQVKASVFYEMTLEQRWVRVFEQENEHNNKGNVVHVKASFYSEAVFVGESRREAVWDERNMVDGVLWFMYGRGYNVRDESVGLSREVFERMRWEEEKVGWVGGGEKRIGIVNKEEKFEGSGGWRRFGCYVLMERFVLKRMDGSLVLTYDFGHSHQIKTIFE